MSSKYTLTGHVNRDDIFFSEIGNAHKLSLNRITIKPYFPSGTARPASPASMHAEAPAIRHTTQLHTIHRISAKRPVCHRPFLQPYSPYYPCDVPVTLLFNPIVSTEKHRIKKYISTAQIWKRQRYLYKKIIRISFRRHFRKSLSRDTMKTGVRYWRNRNVCIII